MAQIKKPMIEPEIHRRILRFLNAARRPEDLMVLPEREVRVDEPRVFKGPDPHDLIDRRAPARKPIALLDLKVAKRLFDARCDLCPLYGFTHIDQIRKVLGNERFSKILDFLSAHFGRATYGEWRDAERVIKDGQTVGVAHGALLCTGSVLFIEAACGDPERKSETPVYNPETGGITFPDPPKVGDQYENLYCSGHSFLSDGKLLVVGGGGENGDTPVPDLAWIFDPVAGTWDYTRDKGNPDNNTNRKRMHKGRWYPTAVTLGDRRVLIASGWPSATDSKMEIYSESAGTFSLVTTQDPPGDKSFPQLYPALHHLPGGEVFFSPTGWGSATIEPSAYIDLFEPTTPDWNDIGSTDRGKGMSVQILSRDYPFVRVMVVGGSDAGKSTSYQVINLSTLSPSWPDDTDLPSLPTEDGPTPRTNVNVVLLPDNTVFVAGGTSADQPCWLYDPAVPGSWTPLANLPTVREYHSFAVLLPSGEVLVSGARGGDSNRNLIEIFSPPYLFNADGSRIDDADRPIISSVTEFPDLIHHGQTFEVGTAQAGDIDKVMLVRPMAVTHQTDTEQRVIQLDCIALDENTLSVTAPNGWHPHAMAPAGCYMLFIINRAGVPSKARFIRLH